MKDIEKMDNKAFYSQLKKFAVPIALQTFMTAAISAGDSAMLGFVNQDSLAAVSLFRWLHCLLLFGRFQCWWCILSSVWMK